MIKMMQNEGLKPEDGRDLSRINAVVLGGAPSTPADFVWLYDNVKSDMRKMTGFP